MIERVLGAAGRSRLTAGYLAKIATMMAVPIRDIANEPRQPSRLLKNSTGTS
jgi:hypothetical protein